MPRKQRSAGPHLLVRWRTRCRLVLAAVLVAAAMAGCGGSSGSGPHPSGAGSVPSSVPGQISASTRPNIVFVLTDDLSSNLVTRQWMPNLWGLEHDGANFTQYFVTDSLCCPSRSSILTGRYPHDTGVFNNSGPDGGYTVFDLRGDQHSTVATDLRAAGYRTALMGKYLNQYEPQDPPAPGWDEWDVTGNAGYGETNYTLNENGRLVHYGGVDPTSASYLTNVLSDRAEAFLRTSGSGPHRSPFFLEVATYAPHAPYIPAPRYADIYPGLEYPLTPSFNRANINAPKWLRKIPPLTAKQQLNIDESFRLRAESVKSIDDMIGRLVTTLKQEGVWHDTYLVFSSDNGIHMGEHQLEPGKLTAFDTDIHVPLIVVGPSVAAGRVVTSSAENIDLRSTFDQWAGTHPGEAVDGRSLGPLLTASSAPPDWPQGVLVEHRGPVLSRRDPDYPPIHGGNPSSYEALRLAGALYVEYADGEREYYDLVTDPYELDNTYRQLNPAYVAKLHAELRRVARCHDAPACSQITAPAPGRDRRV